MKKSTMVALGMLVVVSCLAQKEGMKADMLVPYEVDGKIGFVSQRLEKITEAKYLDIISVSRYCAIVQTEDYRQAVVTFDGREITRRLPFGQSIALIGDTYYAIPETDQENPKEIKTVIRSVFSEDAYVIHDLLLEGGDSLEYIHSTNVSNREYARLNYVNYKGEFRFPVDNTWKRLYSYDETLRRGIVLDEDFDGRVIDSGGNYVGCLRWQRIATEFAGGLVAGVKDNQEGYYDKDGVLKIPVQFHVEQDIHLAPRFNSGVLPCRILDGVCTVYSSEKSFSTVYWSLIDTEGNVIVEVPADRITEFSEGVAILEAGSQFYLIQNDGQKLTPEGFDSIHPSINGYCRAKKGGVDFLISSIDGSLFKCSDF